MPYPWMNIDFEKNPENIPKTLPFPRFAAHALLYCACSHKKCLFGTIPMKYAIMMQLRHDGMIGFPGGYIDEKETAVVGLNRELREEIGLCSKHYVKQEDYIGAWIHSRNVDSLVDHFYVKEYKEKDFLKIEQAVLSSQDWGTETLGLIRVPVYDWRALAEFFNHNFVGNARDQLVTFLKEKKIFDDCEIDGIWALAETN